jgi:hypothetical protein
MWGHYGSKIVGVFQSLLTRHQVRLPISFGGISLIFLCPICFSKELSFGGFVFLL